MTRRLDPAVAAVRRAVRLTMADARHGDHVIVACSGGADSMALAAAAAFVGSRSGWLPSVVVVDHGLHDWSSDVAETVASRLRSLEVFAPLASVEVVQVTVGSTGGTEAAARAARYAVLDEAGTRNGAVVLLGHTRDDQAETVLLGLARGSGLRSLAGMRPVNGRYRRPLLTISRAQTVQVCRVLEVPVWQDPDNEDPRFARVRVRRTVLPSLEREIGPGVAEALARTARQAADDVDALDAMADLAFAGAMSPVSAAEGLEVARLAAEPAAVRRRVLRLAATAAGCPAGELFAVHVEALDALVVGWHGQRGADLPGAVTALRRRGRIVFAGQAPAPGSAGTAEAGRLPPRSGGPAH